MRSARICSPGHADRACDIIAESVIDEYLQRDPETAGRIRVSGGRGALFVSGIIASKADFDVGAIVTRTAASLGVREHVEPFVSIESVPGSFILEATRTHRPISVMGYATRETDSSLPLPVYLAKKIARRLDDLRQNNGEWFWLEPAFEVSVVEDAKTKALHAYIACAHGQQDVARVRERIVPVVQSLATNIRVSVNEHGLIRQNGLDADIGSSGVFDEPYGSSLPLPSSPIGCDPSNPQKFGTWLARGLAKRVLLRNEQAKAVMVQATYLPGDVIPSYLRVRDERGRDLLFDYDHETMTYAYLRKSLRPALSTNAVHWGFAGEVELPWEQA